ncbi:hypothetical protein [Desulfolucanica intricata]|uniref:hypothetical protein n=1 Tax=Desulfolucanica intricata TaxID=1285191 RepID=UPI000A92F047|nr:hypothetical protein [Desulfolucanica intricata]
MLLGVTTSMIEKLAQEIKESGPEEKEHFIRSSIALLEILTETLKTNLNETK